MLAETVKLVDGNLVSSGARDLNPNSLLTFALDCLFLRTRARSEPAGPGSADPRPAFPLTRANRTHPRLPLSRPHAGISLAGARTERRIASQRFCSSRLVSSHARASIQAHNVPSDIFPYPCTNWTIVSGPALPEDDYFLA